jgi:5-methylcytosine-specific restriction endonuclease McrA
VSDRRYSTAAWQRLRRQVLARDGHACMVQGPRCTGHATTVHHLIPSSQAPHLFWEPQNLQASCARCNYGGGARIAATNTKATIARLREIIEQQEHRIEHLLDRITQLEPPAGAPIVQQPPR